eukprot:tig00000489_g1368.t1
MEASSAFCGLLPSPLTHAACSFIRVARLATSLGALQLAGNRRDAERGFRCVASGEREKREKRQAEAEQRVVPSDAVVKAVESLGFKVTDGDVASTAGRELAAVRQELMALAYNAGGHMQVAETGDIVYSFPANFRSVLSSNDRRFRALEVWRGVSGALYKGVRVGFGVSLLLSILLVFVTFVAISISASSSSRGSDDDNDSGERRSRNSFNISFGPSLFDYYYWSRLMNPGWGSYGYSYTVTDYEDEYGAEERRRADLSFPEAVFSFVFGDGDPNAGLAERQWQLVGQVIREAGGAVTAEQVLPYLDSRTFPTTDPRSSFFKYEDYMLPVLLRFQGRPEVSEEGDIVYVFPELLVSTAAAERAERALPPFLEEAAEAFTRADGLQKFLAGGLGALNAVGVASLGPVLKSYAAAQAAGGVIALAASLLWLLRAYALVFVATPVARLVRLRGANAGIEQRNAARAAAAEALLDDPSPQLRRKMRFAREKAREVGAEGRRAVDRKVIFSTEQSALEQDLDGPDADAEWARRLERGRSTRGE